MDEILSIFDFGFAICDWSFRRVGESGNPKSEIGNPKWIDDRFGHEARSQRILDLRFSICDWTKVAARRHFRRSGGGRVLPVPAAGAQVNGVGYFCTSGELC